MIYYAQLDKEGYCIGISQLAEKVNIDNMILLDKYDSSYINRYYDKLSNKWSGEWREVVIPISSNELMYQAITNLELDNMQAQYERELLSQSITNVELMIMGGV